MELNYVAFSSSSLPDICYSSTDYYDVMAEGYRAMAVENLKFAEEALPIALEIWSEYNEEE